MCIGRLRASAETAFTPMRVDVLAFCGTVAVAVGASAVVVGAGTRGQIAWVNQTALAYVCFGVWYLDLHARNKLGDDVRVTWRTRVGALVAKACVCGVAVLVVALAASAMLRCAFDPAQLNAALACLQSVDSATPDRACIALASATADAACPVFELRSASAAVALQGTSLVLFIGALLLECAHAVGVYAEVMCGRRRGVERVPDEKVESAPSTDL